MPVAVSSTPAAAVAATPFGAEDQHDRGGADARPERQLAQRDHRDQDGGGVEQRGVDPDRVEHQPVAQDLREDGDEHERDDAVAPAQAAQHREPLPALAPPAAREPAAARRSRRAATDEADERQPPRQAERTDERERGERGERGLDAEDRHLGGDQRGDARGVVRRASGAARRSARRSPTWGLTTLARLPMPAARSSARRLTVPPAGDDRRVPGLAARHEREDLQRGGEEQDPDRRGVAARWRTRRGGRRAPSRARRRRGTRPRASRRCCASIRRRGSRGPAVRVRRGSGHAALSVPLCRDRVRPSEQEKPGGPSPSPQTSVNRVYACFLNDERPAGAGRSGSVEAGARSRARWRRWGPWGPAAPRTRPWSPRPAS